MATQHSQLLERTRAVTFTIFTPIYNRAHFLPGLYDCLTNQSFSDFEWLIIDDGSTDQCKEIIRELIERNEISIRYVYQDNGGKQSAWNNAVKLANGSFFIGVDSDDIIVPNGLREINNMLPECAHSDIIGLRLCSFSLSAKEALINSNLADGVYNWNNARYILGDTSERIDVFKREILLEYLYPVKPNIKFIPETYFYHLTGKKYSFYFSNYPLRIFNDIHDGPRLTNDGILKHTLGYNLDAEMAINASLPFLLKDSKSMIKYYLKYISTNIHLNKKQELNSTWGKLLYFIFFPLGYLFYVKKFLRN